VESDPVYEVLLAGFAYGGEGDNSAYEVAPEIVSALQAKADESLVEDMEKLGSVSHIGVAFLGVAHDMAAPRTVEAFVETLRSMDPAEMRKYLMSSSGIKPAKGHNADLIDRAAAGDIAAVEELVTDLTHPCNFLELLLMEPVAMRDLLASVVERFAAVVQPVLAEWRPSIERDAANTIAMATTMRPERLVEKVTNGITFEPQPHVSGVLLIPSVAIRPWVVLAEHESLRIFAYSISDEVLAADADTPPAFLVDVFKALGDEKRLRILGVLAEGDLGLKELANRLDLAKSTAHHHLRMLRSAGLVRVIVGADDQRYSLRRDSVPETGRLLESFLANRTPGENQEDNQ
jgi:DNA-binding transcriptional ArsR family regulator